MNYLTLTMLLTLLSSVSYADTVKFAREVFPGRPQIFIEFKNSSELRKNIDVVERPSSPSCYTTSDGETFCQAPTSATVVSESTNFYQLSCASTCHLRLFYPTDSGISLLNRKLPVLEPKLEKLALSLGGTYRTKDDVLTITCSDRGSQGCHLVVKEKRQ